MINMIQLNLIEIFSIITLHYVADFIMQDEKWALGKSKNWNDLLSHTLVYSVMWYIPMVIAAIGYVLFNGPDLKGLNWGPYMWSFPVITFICHTITDYITSKEVSKKFENKEYGSSIPNLGAFSLIGFDQVLHYVQLFLTYTLLK